MLEQADAADRNLTVSAVVALTTRFEHASAALAFDSPALDELADTYTKPTLARLKVVARTIGHSGRPFKNRPYAASVTATTESTNTGAVVTFNLAPVGFWVMGQYGAKAHRIIANERKALHAEGHPHPVRGPINHPGSKGQKAISRAYRVIRQDERELIADVVHGLVAGRA